MTHFSKAPLRLGFAGGGTDVSPYADLFGGAVLNATINLYAHATLEPIDGTGIILSDANQHIELTVDGTKPLPINGEFDLAKGVCNYMQQQYGLPLSGFKLTTKIDAPIGSGLGTSSTLVVAIIGAFAQMQQLQLSPHDIAAAAVFIERHQLHFAGGKQDQYAATFGGFNFMEFDGGDTVLVTPLHLQPQVLQHLQHNILLYYTGQSRNSSNIIAQQQQNVKTQQQQAVEAMHALKIQAGKMRDALLNGRPDEIGQLFDVGFLHKRNMANGISNPFIENVYAAAKKAGATGGKISGAGGGGFMFFYCPQNTIGAVKESLNSFTGQVWDFKFIPKGLETWSN